jgi:hypothetical protein
MLWLNLMNKQLLATLWLQNVYKLAATIKNNRRVTRRKQQLAIIVPTITTTVAAVMAKKLTTGRLLFKLQTRILMNQESQGLEVQSNSSNVMDSAI